MDDFEKWLDERLEDTERPTIGRLELAIVLGKYRSMTCKIVVMTEPGWTGAYQCDVCKGHVVTSYGYLPKYSYCPNCGRKVVD